MKLSDELLKWIARPLITEAERAIMLSYLEEAQKLEKAVDALNKKGRKWEEMYADLEAMYKYALAAAATDFELHVNRTAESDEDPNRVERCVRHFQHWEEIGRKERIKERESEIAGHYAP